MSTGITVEEADLLSFATPEKSGHPLASRGVPGQMARAQTQPVRWGPADAPPYSLIGRIGSGSPFYIGPVNNKVVRNDGGMLFLGINDPIPEGNWGSGFTCTVT